MTKTSLFHRLFDRTRHSGFAPALGRARRGSNAVLRRRHGGTADIVKTGLSKLRENTAFPMGERRITQRRLETLLEESGRSFGLVKLDLQGAELDVLRGLSDRLAGVKAILTEISLVPYYAGVPFMPDVLSTLDSLGFALHDVVDELRDTNGSLLQVDGLFLRQTSASDRSRHSEVDRMLLRQKAELASFRFGRFRTADPFCSAPRADLHSSSVSGRTFGA